MAVCIIFSLAHFVGGLLLGWYLGESSAADQAVSDQPEWWWNHDLIKARARKECAALKKKVAE